MGQALRVTLNMLRREQVPCQAAEGQSRRGFARELRLREPRRLRREFQILESTCRICEDYGVSASRYAFSRLYSVLRLMPSVSAAAFLSPAKCSSVSSMSSRSTSRIERPALSPG